VGAFDRTVELALTSIVFGLVGVFSPTRTGMTVLLLASRVRPWARTVAYAAGSTAIFALVILLGLLGVEATSLNMQVPVTIALGFTLVGVGVGMIIARRRNPDREPTDPRHPILSAAGVGVGVSIQAPGRLILLIAGGYRIGDLAGSAAVAVAFAAAMLAIWQLPIWGTMILSIVAPDRFGALERRARPALERVESGPVGAILVAAIGMLLVIRGLTS
jgi:hypothetical protein